MAPQHTDNHTDIHEPFVIFRACQFNGEYGRGNRTGGGWVRACAYSLTGVYAVLGVLQGFMASRVIFWTMGLVGPRCSMDWDVRGRACMHVYVPCV